MFDGRIYRAAFVPFLFVLAIAGFSLSGQASPLASTLAPDAFNGPRAFAGLQALVKRFPDRQPGSAGDNELAAYIAAQLRGLGSPSGTTGSGPSTPASGESTSDTVAAAAAGGFQVSTRQIQAATIEGTRTLTTVIAERPGSTALSPIVIMAHRDAPESASAAQLSGTAALLELARVFAESETRRTIELVSTSGGSGGYAGATDFAKHNSQSPDAAIVLGDLAGSVVHKPFVLPFSSKPQIAPEALQRTLDGAISQDVGTDSGAPGLTGQLAQLALPLTTGEEAPLNSATTPAVLVQVSGQRGPTASEKVSANRLQNFGKAVLSSIYALDEAPNIAPSFAARVSLGHKLLPGWAVRLLALALLLPPLLVGVDALARLRRRREPVRRWVVWTLSGALPFLASALFAVVLGALGIVATPASQLSAGALSADGSVVEATLATAFVLALALLAWPALARRLALPLRPSADGAALAVLLVLLVVALLTWIFNPFACLLLIPALHLWLVALGPGRRSEPQARALAYGAIALGALPLLLLALAYARELGLGVGGLAESTVLALAGGQLGPLGVLLWSVALGCLFAVLLLAPAAETIAAPGTGDWSEIATRGPASYAGPGSLGGTESALRR
ncbi:MAG TPA: M28 family peptidase [Solirubrobacteraceae bacterium]|nr:M28 family peptidase [Solirubrobacteraceae bacterium]